MSTKPTGGNSNSNEDLSDKEDNGIITNIDEFCTINELIQNPPKNNNIKNKNIMPKLQLNNKAPQSHQNKINEPFKISSPIQNINNNNNLYNLLLNGENKPVKNKKALTKKLKFKKKSKKKTNIFTDNLNLKNFLELSKRKGKSVFLKISEDTFTKLKSKPNKEVRDINKTEEDAYNKMTSDPYIRTCGNKENMKNKIIVQQCLDRKAKEDIFKKIGIECDRNREKKKLQDPKRAFSVTDRNINFKSTRTLAQFLRDQKGERKKDKKYNNKNNKKIPLPFKKNILPQDSTFVFSENKEELNSQISNVSENFLDFDMECKSMLQNNEKYKINIEEEKDNMNNKHNNNKSFQNGKERINNNNFSILSGNNEKNKLKNNKNIKNNLLHNINNNDNKNQKKNLKDTSTATKSKNSLENNTKKFLDLYKEIIETEFDQKIENNFEINFSSFLLILYKIGFTNKNYFSLMESLYDVNTKKMGTMHPSVISDISISNSSLNFPINNNNPININKSNILNNNNNSIGGKSLEDEGENYTINSFQDDKEFNLIKDAWKILTEKKDFDTEISISSKIFFLFIISVMGIGDYLKGKKNFKKEFDFFFNDKKLVNQYNNMNKYINKYFGIFSLNASEYSLDPEKRNLILKSSLNSDINSYSKSIATSFVVNNSEINNKYNIYEKNYNKNKNIDNFDEMNSIQLFNDGIKEEEKFFYTINNRSEKSYNTLTFTDVNNIENNHNNNLLNSSLTDTSSIFDLKKFLNPNNSEKMEDEVEIDSFLFDNNKKNYFKYNNNSKLNDKKGTKLENEKKPKNKNNKSKAKKRVKYVFEIKVENEMKKLIINKGEDKDFIVSDFCKKYNVNEEEKNKILKIIEDRLQNLNGNLKKLI